jgi:hypothetical protein
MTDSEVPQDDENMLQGKFKKLMYATDGSQHYTEVQSAGWEAENVVLRQAWEDIADKVAAAQQQVISGTASPLLYHMERHLMDTSILSGYVGYPAFIVRLHLYPFFFKRLSQATLDKYAFAFRISVADMLDLEKIKTEGRIAAP